MTSYRRNGKPGDDMRLQCDNCKSNHWVGCCPTPFVRATRHEAKKYGWLAVKGGKDYCSTYCHSKAKEKENEA